MATSKEDAIEHILAIAAEHNILFVLLEDNNPDVGIQAPVSLEVVGKLRGRPQDGTDALVQRTLFLEIHFRDEVVWGPQPENPKARVWN